MRAIPQTSLLVLALSGSLFLAACGGDGEPSTDASASAVPSASASASATPSATPAKVPTSKDFAKVDVSGAYGKTPKVTIDKPYAIDKTRTKVLDSSDGAVVGAGQTVEVNYYGVDGRTGKKFDESFSAGKPVAFSLDQVVPGFSKGLTGQKKGSRVLIAMPGSDGYDASGGNAQAGIEVGDTLVFVVDIVDVQLSEPTGTAVKPAAGLPTVSGPLDKPVITIPKTDPPSKLVVQPLIKGDGKKVGAGDTITFAYRWQIWQDGRLVEESYGQKPGSSPLSGLVAGLQEGLEGQTVGSRVLLVIPPDKGYPDGNAQPKVEKGETLVMVVDLLFTQAGQ
ncbi:FKBP-type peptidyl-prolyl cis-trans isomerase [Microlunatus capsulatus]|uniref:peptidylprolyl isomerase n=1 Tax=Microlunatus capsulatus TaxID=99117 RepID=A0ABS4ZEV8_9ACTN|nr:FKBP-type peptidyl-prolyl cis-trans isomerase [Microlunatus capsulatus]MBP2418768.1 peptidylprolyl isomerase [Microlunatus capsulatus]